ncbi:MAG: tryptophan synthase subunit alpha [Solirubrobacterales bacterium]|nr:tryptophan synthase subunit alpha [Solirubrobacterales bacterium]MBV9869826.1 tryptophan synthase subunit alpha [Frankiaceae bacterium]
MRSGEAYAAAKAAGRAAVVGYLPAGFPSYDGCLEAMKAMVDGGVDIVEVGLPYSDPVLDGPVIQAATERALRGGTRIFDVLRTAEAVAGMGVATVVMTYFNPVLAYGVERFAADLAAAGGSGLITPDLIPDEAAEWLEVAAARDLERIFLVAPSSSASRIAATVDACDGWVYAASTMGVTGARAATSQVAPSLVGRVREHTDLPIGVGLGVSNGEQAAEVASYADGVIVGSALVRCLLDSESPAAGVAAVGALTADLAAGVRRAA